MPALEQSYLRTKTTDYASFRKTQEMRTDTSNNTVYADADGTIAYFHGNFIPKRNPKFDFTHPVDGSNPATEWQGPHALEDTITLLNPEQRLDSEHQQLAVLGGGRGKPEARELSSLHVDQRRKSPRHTRRRGSEEYSRRDLG